MSQCFLSRLVCHVMVSALKYCVIEQGRCDPQEWPE